MAKQYIVKSTIHGVAKAGAKKVVLLASPNPQDVPSGLVKELLERGLIEEVAGGTKAASAPATGEGDGGSEGGSGDENSGD